MFIHWSVLSSGLLWMRPVIRVLRPDISCLSSRTVCGSCSNGIFSVEGIALLFLMFNNGFFFVRTEKVCRDSVVESRHKYLVRPARTYSNGRKSPNRPDSGKVTVKGKGVHREVESEGSRRQTVGPMNKNLVEGWKAGVMLLEKQKPDNYPNCRQ